MRRAGRSYYSAEDAPPDAVEAEHPPLWSSSLATLSGASLVLGIVALTLAVLMSSTACSAGERTRTAMALSDPPEQEAPAGLLLGLLVVMIASIP